MFGVGLRRRHSNTHSSRRATIGSTLLARRAGKYAASSATIEMPRMAVINVGGSDGVRPKSCAPTRRVAAIVAGSPRSTPIPRSNKDSLIIIHCTFLF